MTNERFELGIKIVAIVTIILLVCEVMLAVGVLKQKTVSVSVLDDIDKDVSNSELLKEQDLNEINLEDLYVEE